MKSLYNNKLFKTPQLPSIIEGEVVNNDDPDNKGRIKVFIPSIFEGTDDNKFWIKPMMPFKSFVVPDIGDIVTVTFFNNKVSKGFYFSQIYKEGQIPTAYRDDSNNKIIYAFNNENYLAINDEESTFELSIGGKTSLTIDQYGKITLISGNPDLDDVEIYSPNNLTLKSDKKLSIRGSEVDISEIDDDITTVVNKKAKLSLKDGEVNLGIYGTIEATAIDSALPYLNISSDAITMQYNNPLTASFNTIKLDDSNIAIFNKTSYINLNTSGVALSGNSSSSMWLNGTINFLGVTNLLGTAPASPIAIVPTPPIVYVPPVVNEIAPSLQRNVDMVLENNTVALIQGYVDDFKKKQGLTMSSDVEILSEFKNILL